MSSWNTSRGVVLETSINCRVLFRHRPVFFISRSYIISELACHGPLRIEGASPAAGLPRVRFEGRHGECRRRRSGYYIRVKWEALLGQRRKRQVRASSGRPKIGDQRVGAGRVHVNSKTLGRSTGSSLRRISLFQYARHIPRLRWPAPLRRVAFLASTSTQTLYRLTRRAAWLV